MSSSGGDALTQAGNHLERLPGRHAAPFATRTLARAVPEQNAAIARRLRQAADMLSAQGAGPFRVAAYRRAAESVLALDEELGIIFERGGRPGLDAIPGIGPSIASAIAEICVTGRWGYLEHLKGVVGPEQLFRAVPGIGPQLARQIHETLQIDTLEALEAAAHDGRLQDVPGFGPRRAAMVRSALAEMLARVRRSSMPAGDEPTIAMLLDVDREYRQKASAGALVKIAPKRFNPAGEAWLPILHTVRGPWNLTALYSNTARAHQLAHVTDWVVIYFHKGYGPEGQRTVVTEPRYGAVGRRVVRGREAECLGSPLSHAGENATR